MAKPNIPAARKMAILRDVEMEEYLIDCVRLDDNAIDEEFVRVGADIAYWNARYTEALKEHLITEYDHECLVDQAKIEEREKLKARRVAMRGRARDVLETEVRSAVNLRPDVQVSKLRAINAEVEKERMRRFADSVGVKKDALQSLGARLRAQIERDATVRRRYLDGREASQDREDG